MAAIVPQIVFGEKPSLRQAARKLMEPPSIMSDLFCCDATRASEQLVYFCGKFFVFRV